LIVDYFNLPVSIFTPQLGNDTLVEQKDNYYLEIVLKTSVGVVIQAPGIKSAISCCMSKDIGAGLRNAMSLNYLNDNWTNYGKPV